MSNYRKNSIKSKIHRVKPKKSIFKMIWFWIAVLTFIIIFAGLYFFFFFPDIQVKNISVSGNQKVNAEELKNLVSDNTNNKILGLVDSRSIFLASNKKISKKVLDKFPEIEKTTINKSFPQTLKINIVERKPIGVFCSSENGNCFFIDANGIIFEPVAEPSADSIIVRQNVNNSQVAMGKRVVERNIMDLISRVKKDLKDNFQIGLKTATVASDTRLNMVTSENWQIYFDISANSDVESQIKKIDLLLKGEIPQEKRKNLRYINLMPKDRAIVCDNSTCGG
jgi:cell division septal protein FtsQ